MISLIRLCYKLLISVTLSTDFALNAKWKYEHGMDIKFYTIIVTRLEIYVSMNDSVYLQMNGKEKTRNIRYKADDH